MKKILLFAFIFLSLYLLGADKGDVEITITEAETEMSLSNVRINLVSPKNSYKAVSEDGNAFFFDIAPGKYKLSAELDGYQTKSKDIDFDFNKKDFYSGTITLEKDEDSKPYNVILSVKDDITEEGLDGATVSLKKGKSVYEVSCIDGNASFRNIPSGKYELTVELNSYKTKSSEINLDFSKKDVMRGTVSLEQDKKYDDYEIKPTDPLKVFKGDKEITVLLIEDIALQTKVNEGKAQAAALGMHRAKLASMMLERALSKNNSEYFTIAWQSAYSAASLAPKNPYPWLVFGYINLTNADSLTAQAFATDALTNCLELDPKNTQAAEYLAQSYYIQHDYANCAQMLEQILYYSKESPDPMLIGMLCYCYFAGDMYVRGCDYMKTLCDKFPNSAQARLQLANLLNSEGQKKDALKELDAVIKSKNSSEREIEIAKKLIYFNKEN